MNKALFLDRDGILNVDKGYVYRWEDIVWFEEIFEIIKLANDKNYKVIVLTNQSGIFQQKYSHRDVLELHKLMNEYLNQKGALVDDWFYCAEMDSDCRKPRPGMLYQAQKKFNIDLAASIMVGDKVSDIFETGEGNPHPQTFLVQGNYDLSSVLSKPTKNVILIENHKALKKILTEYL
ncbi:MAG: HAD family hydrolase [Bacteriovoracaceae bacterium]|nr:HAD family hydrolase [Bacteriovoracaceae bacterium]